MARRVTIQTLCDPCLKQDREVDGENLPPLTLIGSKPRIIALCPEHMVNIYKPLLEAVREFGQPIDIEPAMEGQPARKASSKRSSAATSTAVESSPAKPPPSEPIICPECGRDDFQAPQGLGAHRWRAHGVQSPAKAAAAEAAG